MEFLKIIFSNLDFNLSASTKTLEIFYGESSIRLYITEEGKVRLSTSLVLDTPTAQQ